MIHLISGAGGLGKEGLMTDTSVIRMDLSTVNKKFKDEKHETVEQVLDDVQLIRDNCKTYNPEERELDHSVA